ncbi:MAG: aromatic amino acid transport family protein [bacterium]
MDAKQPPSAKHTLLAIGTFLGTIIGVGIFSLPSLAGAMGLFPFVILLVLLALFVLVIHLRLADVVLGTQGEHRIPGYVGVHLGARWKRLCLGISSFGLVGALLAYLVAGGVFLQLALRSLGDVPIGVTSLVFFLLASALIVRGTKGVSWVDLLLVVTFFLLITLFFFISFPKIDMAIYHELHWSRLATGYGVLLFALWGLSIIPETVELARRDRSRSRRVLTVGLCAATLLYFFFVVMVLGVAGHATTPDALTGFLTHFSPWVVAIGGLLGAIPTFTSFTTLGMTLKKTLQYDFHFRPSVALLLTIIAPPFLFILGFRNLLDILGLTGALLLGCEGAFVLVIADRVRQPASRQLRPSTAILLALLVLGVGCELWTFFQ